MKIILILVLLNASFNLIFSWPNHDIKTLKLLQIIHRHGDRTPIIFSPKDPFKDVDKYWKDGPKELTIRGKYRLYQLGKLIRKEYANYFGQIISPKEIYVRSSVRRRTLESASALLAGLCPPGDDFKWDSAFPKDKNNKSFQIAELGKIWQPIAVETSMPFDDDILLVVDKTCPNLGEEERLLKSDKAINILREKESFLNGLGKIMGEKIDSLEKCMKLYDTLFIETDNDYIWTKIWNKQEQIQVVNELKPLNDAYWEVIFNSILTQRVRAGTLIKALRDNMIKKIKGVKKEKFIEYSAHDSTLTALMSAFGIYNNLQVPYGSTLFIELHQDNLIPSTQWIKIWYLNETFSEQPFEMKMPGCYDGVVNACKLSTFFKTTELFMIKDYDKECGSEVTTGGDKRNAQTKIDKQKNGITSTLIGFCFGVLASAIFVMSFFAFFRFKLLFENKFVKYQIKNL